MIMSDKETHPISYFINGSLNSVYEKYNIVIYPRRNSLNSSILFMFSSLKGLFNPIYIMHIIFI